MPLTLGLPIAGRHQSTAYLIAPVNALKRGDAYLEWQYDETMLPEGAPPSWLYIEDGTGSQLECFVDPERGLITASTSHLGLFRIRWSSEADSRSADPGFIEVGPCYPNPFSHTVTVNFTLKSRQPVYVGIFDLRGRLVKTLLDGVANPGCRSIIWDGTADGHSKVPPGIYFVRITSCSRSRAIKLALIR